MAKFKLPGAEVTAVQFWPERPEIEITIALPAAVFEKRIKPCLGSDRRFVALGLSVAGLVRLPIRNKKLWCRHFPLPRAKRGRDERRA